MSDRSNNETNESSLKFLMNENFARIQGSSIVTYFVDHIQRILRLFLEKVLKTTGFV